MTRLMTFFAALGLLFFASLAHAIQAPTPLPGDSRMRTLVYNPNDVYSFTGYYGFQSIIEFEPGEKLDSIIIGDSLAWQIVPSEHRLFLKPVEPDAVTNMTIISNRRTYLMELHAEQAEDIRDPGLVFLVRFIYPQNDAIVNLSGEEMLPDLIHEAHRYNFNYTLTGPEYLAPIRIFDDGRFTYFEFPDKNAEIPAFFSVDRQGEESIINYRVEGPYIVVERLSPRFSLRHGGDIICVYNENLSDRLLERAPVSSRKSTAPVQAVEPFGPPNESNM